MIAKNSNTNRGNARVSKGRRFGVATDVEPLDLTGKKTAGSGTTISVPGYVDTGLRQVGIAARDTLSTALGVALGGQAAKKIWG